MELDVWKAILSGAAGTAVMTAGMYMGFLMNMRMDVPMMLGTMFLPKGPVAWALGLMVHLMMGAVFFVAYALLFDLLAIESGIAGWSVIFGLVHGSVAGMALGTMPGVHPRMAAATGPGTRGFVADPGRFALNMGVMGPLALLALHATYGLVAGLAYSGL